MARFFAAWFGVVPFKLSDLHINLTAETAEYFPEGPHQRGSITVPPFSLASDDISEKSKTAAAAKDEAVAVFNADVAHARTDNFALESGAGSELLGGTHAPETDLTGTLKRFLKEIIPDCVCQRSYKTPPNPWLDAEIGIASDHRTMHKRPTTIIEGLENVVRSSHGIIFDSFLSREDYAVALRTTSDARALEDRTSSLTGLMNHMENRGHAAASFVEGLTVELLPFQSQSLQWAMERETAPGGLQSFFWTTLPKIFDGDDDDPKNNAAEAYFNPILGKVTRKKPKLVRGGIIAEQMGLGKTVISLALILQNPAPAAPPSGSPVASIPAQQPSTSPFWDPTLFGHSSVSNKKRGSILSRGTLVVVS